MKLDQITDNMRRRLSPEAKKALGAHGMTQEEAQASFAAKNEKQLQDQIANLLRLRGIAFYRSRMDQKTTGAVGWPDMTFAVHGQAAAMEVKHGGNGLDPDQVKCIEAMMKNGWDVRVIRSVQEAITMLDELEENS